MSRRRSPDDVVTGSGGSQAARLASDTGNFLSAAHNMTIKNAEFNNVHGHLVINLNQNPPAQNPSWNGTNSFDLNDPSIQSFHKNTRRPNVPESENLASNQLPVQPSNVIYQRHLEPKGYGFPLWIPSVSQNLPLEYRRTGVRIGDVGIITPNGEFSFLFNICLPRDDPVNLRSLPEHFSPISAAPSIDKFIEFSHGSHLASTSIQKTQANFQPSGFQFESSASEGAILAMPLGATSEKLRNVAIFRQYAASNMDHWYKFVNVDLGFEVKNGDIRLVIGHVKTKSWGIATFANQSHQSSCHLRFGPSSNSSSSDSSRYFWEYSGIADVRAGPSPGENDGLRQVDDSSDVVYENQCLFLRALTATLPDSTWSKIHCDPASGTPQLGGDLHPAKDPAFTTASVKSSTLSYHSSDLNPEVQSNMNAFDDEPVVLDSYPLSTRLGSNQTQHHIDHPSNALNDILMEMVPDAHMVITDDDDWSSVASKHDTVSDPHELLEQVLITHCICQEDGIIFLVPRETIESGISNAQELVLERGKTLSVSQTQPSRDISLPCTVTPRPNVPDNSSPTLSVDHSNTHESFFLASKPSIVDSVSTHMLPSLTTSRTSAHALNASDTIMPSSSSSDSADIIEISDITIKAPMIITSIELSIESTFRRNFNLAKDKLKETTVTLAPAMPCLPSSSSSPLIIKVRLESVLSFNKSQKIEAQRKDLLSNAVDVAPNKREYRRTVNGIEVIIRFMLLPQTSRDENMNENLNETPTCFRLLIVGRTGVGKTSLMMSAFGITEAYISRGEVGECDINKEHFSFDENKRIIVHQSKGFEPGDVDNFDIVTKFLNDRKREPNLKDQVHAVWLCFNIPVASDRLFETGSEKFLQMLPEGQLGKMPVIAIFTKYDQLVDHIDFYDNPERNTERAKVKAKVILEELCVKPFREHIGGRMKIPTIAVSTDEEYEWTLLDLTRLTTKLVREYLTEDVALRFAAAQQVNPALVISLRLDAVVAVAKKQWQAASVLKVLGNRDIILQNMIHQDIIRIWDLQDPLELLHSNEFTRQIAGIISVQDVHWIALLFNQGIILRLMIYIVALTIIMQNIFVITTYTNNVVSRRLVKLALKVFLESSQKETIPSIKEYMQRPANYGQDAILQKITELINSNRISPKDMAGIKNVLKNIEFGVDESW